MNLHPDERRTTNRCLYLDILYPESVAKVVLEGLDSLHSRWPHGLQTNVYGVAPFLYLTKLHFDIKLLERIQYDFRLFIRRPTLRFGSHTPKYSGP